MPVPIETQEEIREYLEELADDDDANLGSVDTDETTIDHTLSGLSDTDGPLELHRQDSLQQEGKLIITEAGAETKDVNGKANIRIYRAGGSLSMLNNLIWNNNTDSVDLEKSDNGNLEASAFEVGQEGVQSYIWDKNTSSLEKLFTASTKSNAVGALNGYPFIVTDQSTAVVDETQPNTYDFQVHGRDFKNANVHITNYSSGSSNGSGFVTNKSRSGSVGSAGGALQSGDTISKWLSRGDDGSTVDNNAAIIQKIVDGSVSTDIIPTRIEIGVTDTSGNLNRPWILGSDGTVTHKQGTVRQQRGDPSTSELAEGENMTYNSDGSGTGSAGDLVYAVNDGGTIKTTVIAQKSNAT